MASPSFKCGHLFCLECIEGTLNVKVKERPRGAVTCPMHKCSQLVTEEELTRIGVKRDLVMQWRRAIAREILSSTDRVVHCKALRCNAVLRLGPESITSNLCCQECGYEFCCDCDYPAPHAPATCEMMAKWREKEVSRRPARPPSPPTAVPCLSLTPPRLALPGHR